MTVLLDTGVLYAHHDEDAGRHDDAEQTMSHVLSGAFGRPITTDFVYDEAVTLALARTGDSRRAKRLGQRLRGAGDFPDAIDLEFVGRPGFRRAIDIFESYEDHDLSFTDATIIAHIRLHDLDHVLTFDDDFDGIVDRIDPRDVA